MVFYIDHSIHDVLITRELSEGEAIFFADLATMHRKGICYLCGNILSLDDLSQKLGTPSSSIYRSVKNQYAESGAVMSAVQTVIVLTFDNNSSSENLPSILQERDKICLISVAMAQNWSQNKQCCLLAENLKDCKFYERIAAYYCLTHNIKGLRISFHHENGGGNTTCKVLQKCVSEERFLTLCIVDSDIKHGISTDYPNEPAKGTTYQSAKQVSDDLSLDKSLPPHAFFPLDIHEVENLIPISILRRMEDQLPAIKEGLDLLEQLRGIDNGEPILYYDFKNGYPFIEVGPRRSYWKEIVLAIGKTDTDMPPCDKQSANADMQPVLSLPPISRNDLLGKAILLLDDSTLTSLYLDAYLFSLWDHIGRLLLTWGCAGLPLSA